MFTRLALALALCGGLADSVAVAQGSAQAPQNTSVQNQQQPNMQNAQQQKAGAEGQNSKTNQQPVQAAASNSTSAGNTQNNQANATSQQKNQAVAQNQQGKSISVASQLDENSKNLVRDFVLGTQLQIQLSQAAQQKAQSQAVKDFANQLLSTTKGIDKVQAFATQNGIDVQTDPAGKYKAVQDGVMAQSGANFDKMYVDIIRMQMEDLTNRFEQMQAQEKDPQLEDLIKVGLPAVKQYSQQAQQLAQQIATGTGQNNQAAQASSKNGNRNTPQQNAQQSQAQGGAAQPAQAQGGSPAPQGQQPSGSAQHQEAPSNQSSNQAPGANVGVPASQSSPH